MKKIQNKRKSCKWAFREILRLRKKYYPIENTKVFSYQQNTK